MANALQQRLASTTLATALLVALAAPAFAQTAAAPAAPAPMASQPPPTAPRRPARRRAPRHSPEERQQRMERHAAELKQKLQITPAQESAWTAFTTAMQPPADAQARHEAMRDLDKLTTPERIDRLRALRTQHAAEADRRDEAVKTFYAALTPPSRRCSMPSRPACTSAWPARTAQAPAAPRPAANTRATAAPPPSRQLCNRSAPVRR